MKIKWLGHACFLLTGENGIRIVTDPFDATVGYPLPKVEADIVTTSHAHFDHNYTDAVEGDFEVVDGIGDFYIKDIPIKGVKTYHDDAMGEKRGGNVVYIMEIDGLKVCHLGDLGHLLDENTIEHIGPVDVLLIPVGGYYTIDAEQAMRVIAQLAPKLVIPMHFKTPAIDFPIAGVDVFLDKIGGGEKVGSNEIEVAANDLGAPTRVKVLEYK
ncbi:MAG: Zn-dependent hydrolases of the metallo-beta-lactamase superfamily [Firmicutes bacterium]|nr:Zn-dependent hydrolases of the metallo-beta-lactamase superfamily [Bacillota bacterium]